jgi:DNA-binding transcriptional MerR regulator
MSSKMPLASTPASKKARESAPAAGAEAAHAAQARVASHRDADAAELFGISQLCADFGTTPRALRFYESKGLLQPRRINGTRVYTRRDRARLALIIRSKTIGASLAEIRQFLDMYGAHGEGRTQQMRFVLQRTGESIAELEKKRAHIDATLDELRLIQREAQMGLDVRRRAKG